MSNAIDVTTDTWDAEVAASDVPVVVDFWAPWCGPCRMVGPEIDKLSARLGSAVKFVKVNIDDNG
jgi:thioredoxin 1